MLTTDNPLRGFIEPMAHKVRIVTDSSAQFTDPSIIQRYNITVVPLKIQLGDRLYKEGVDLDPDDFFRKVSHDKIKPVLLPPDVDTLADTYARLNRETDQILSLHLSRLMHSTWEAARIASQTLLGRCEIAVVDSQTASVGLAMLVEAAAKLAEETTSLDDIVREVRSMAGHIYSIFYVETIEHLQRSGLVGESQAILGTMLGIKPFLTIEEGELITMEKVRTRPQAIDKLVEFVTEFAGVEQLVILQHTHHLSEQTRTLQERLALEVSSHPFPVVTYKPSLGTFIGPDAMGIIVFENEEAMWDDSDVGFDDNYSHHDEDEDDV
jgi:DegV family protein with EDD domain